MGLARPLTAVGVVAATLTLVAPLAFGREAMLGVAIGGALAVSNLWAIGVIVRGFLRGAGSYGVFGAMKLLVLLFVVWLVLKNGWAQALPLAFGYAALPLGIVVGQLRGAPARQKV
jgi:hypothetical protein